MATVASTSPGTLPTPGSTVSALMVAGWSVTSRVTVITARAGAGTATRTVRVTPSFVLALSTGNRGPVGLRTVASAVASVAPAGTTTPPGTCTTLGSLDVRDTMAPPAGAAAMSRTRIGTVDPTTSAPPAKLTERSDTASSGAIASW